MDSRFALTRMIYTGPRSIVCAGRDRLSEREVAIKISRNADIEVSNMMRAVDCDPRKVNALVMKRVVEPHELCLDGFDKEDEVRNRGYGVKAVVMELHDPAPEKPPHCQCDYFACLALRPYFSSVAELHSRSTLDAHCDVKYSNFVVPEGGDPSDRCLIDFELAQPHVRTSKNRKRGTPAFMAPESVMWGEVNWSVDSWALGIMLFQACHPGRAHPFFPDNFICNSELHHAMAVVDYRPDMWCNDTAPLAADLAERLLQRRICKRIGPEEALCHPLFNAWSRDNIDFC